MRQFLLGLTLFLTIFAYICLVSLCLLVFPSGDDYRYGSYPRDYQSFVNEHIEHYMNNNGRFVVHLLVTVFLFFETGLWAFINPLIILATLVLIVKIADTGNFLSGIAAGLLFFFSIDIGIAKESIYWLTGSFNYLFSSFLVLLVYYLYKKYEYAKPRIALLVCLYILAFLGGATMEQTGLMLIGLISLDIAHRRFISKEKNHAYQYIVLFLVLAGYLTVILSPGIISRFYAENSDNNIYKLYRRLSWLLHLTFYNRTMILIETFLLISSYHWLKKDNGKLSKVFKFCTFLPVLFYIARYSPIIKESTPAVYYVLHILFAAIYTIVVTYTYVRKYKTEKRIIPLSFFLTAYIAQIMLVTSGDFGTRTLLPTVLFLLVIIISEVDEYICKYAYLLPFAIMFSMYVFARIFSGYYQNAQIHKENLAVIRASQNAQKIILNKMADDTYGMSFPYNSPYHLYWYKVYYGINEDTELIFSD